jgi:N-acetyl-D-muramate 6-phosphate phosphatase
VTHAVLFDLDGTLADTAPDLAWALNQMRAARGLPPLQTSATRPVTSLGARGLLNVGFDVGPGHPEYSAMRAEFLRLYERNICRESQLFPGMAELLGALDARGLRWGVVTNKAEHLARLLLDALGLSSRSACIVGGDTTAHLKPHPDPLLAACRIIQVDAGACIYAGDDQRDIEAGRAAGMKVAAVRWGYLNGGRPESWNADWLVDEPRDLLQVL